MALNLTFDEYESKYKRIINAIEIDEPINEDGYYEYSTSLDSPISFDDDIVSSNTLFINNQYLKANLEKVIELVIDTVSSTIKDSFQINIGDLITRDTINAIAKNKKIKKVILLPDNGLNKEDIYALLDGDKENISCTVNYDNEELLYEPFKGINILNYPSIGGINIGDFYHNKVNLLIDYELSNEELTRLKKLFEMFPQDIIRIEFEVEEQMDEILSFVNANVISIKNKNNWSISEYEHFNSKYDNIMIEIKDRFDDDIFVKPSILIEKEKILTMMVSEVKGAELSPLEQYMYLYNIVKFFKEYKELPNDVGDDSLSREVIHILFNDYMVCVGYVLLLEELVDRLDNPNVILSHYSCYVEEDIEVIGHIKALVKITDEKYNIDGIYVSDPTWDSVEYFRPIKHETEEFDAVSYIPVAHYDYYNHFLMTKDEVMDEDVEYASADVCDILFKQVSSLCKSNPKERVYSDADDIMKKFLNNPSMNRTQIDAAINNINQEPISIAILASAIKTIYSRIYIANDGELNKLVNDTFEINSIAQEKHFHKTKDKFSGCDLAKIKGVKY